MSKSTQNAKKQRYLAWFLHQFKLQVPSAEKLLRYLIKSPDLLAKIHLVENVRNQPNAILISSAGADTFPFLCRLQDEYIYDIDEIIVKLSQNPPEGLLIWLSVDRTMVCSACQDNLTTEGSEYHQTRSLQQMIQEISIDYSLKIQVAEAKAAELALQLDQALDQGDRESFNRLSIEYLEIMNILK